MRLWGKIHGSQADYFIVEAVQEGGGGDEGEEDVAREVAEPRGTGANQYVYWVTNSPLQQWT